MMFTHSGKPTRAGLAAVFLALALFETGRVSAQQFDSNLPLPRLNTVFPSGAKAGTTVDVTFTGTDLEEPDHLVFSHPGIKAEPIEGKPTTPPPPPDPKKRRRPRLPLNVTHFRVTVAANVPVGFHDVRFVNRWGVSNSRSFVVGDLPEVVEKEPNNDLDQAQRIALNSTVHGNMASPTDVDYFVFSGKKGQRVVLSCLASSIDSRLNAAIEVFDAKNRLLAQNRNYRDRDAVADLTLPEDGDYFVRLFHFTHTAGNQEYYYRLTVSTAPWIDAIFPPMVEPGKPAKVTVFGRNLPGGRPDPTKVVDGSVLEQITVTINPPSGDAALSTLNYSEHITPLMTSLDGFEYRLRNETGVSNPYLLTYARAPVVLEATNNDTPESAQEVTVPCEIAGRIEKRRDSDWYAFNAKKGDVFMLELFSDRLGSPGDLYFLLRSATNKQTIVELDDDPLSQGGNSGPLGAKFFARTDDPPAYRFVVPADGRYELLVSSKTASQFGPRNVYRMRITPEAPDFRLIVVGPDAYRPSTTCVHQGGNELIRVLAWRNDGFNGDIALSVEGLPKGVTCPPQSLGTGLRHTVLVLSAAADAAAWEGAVKVKGTAEINGKTVVREARAGCITWQGIPAPNFPRAARADRSLFVAVRDKAPWNLTATIDKPEVAQGTNAVITVKLNRLWPDFKAPLLIQAAPQSHGNPPFLPQTLNVQQSNINPGQTEAKLNVNVNPQTPPGTYNIVLRTQAQFPFKDSLNRPRNPPIIIQPSTPVTLVVLPKTLANVTARVGQPNVKAGGQTEVFVRVDRQFNFDGEFKVKLVLPANVQGISADEVVLPAGQSDAKLVVKVAPDAKPGSRGNLIVRATAMFHKKEITHNAQPVVNLNVTK
ncbi:MAG: PPC domain-containing protein [Planctomycetes bacterium]|nr:PPC domain-containing protein [Planctomycetota bacterium]